MRTLERTLVHYDEDCWLVRVFGRDWKMGNAATLAIKNRPDLRRVTMRGSGHSGMLWTFVREGDRWVWLGNAFPLEAPSAAAVPDDAWPEGAPDA
jgi:hypothetical protein